jgi:hypothetical protein
MADLQQLDTPGRSPDKRVALAAQGDAVAVAWVSAAGQLRIATRRLGAAATDWLVEDITASAEAPFTLVPSEHLALGLSPSGEQFLLVHDAGRRALVALRRVPGAAWRMEIVDDGLGSGLESCPVEQRVTTRRGLGLEPALLIAGQQVVVAYHDADCGDLRVARRGQARWLVTVVDDGTDLAAQPSLGITGRFPSIALSPLGVITLAYQDASRGRLMFAALDGDTITRQIVDTGVTLDPQGKRRREVVGAFAHTSFDRQGRAVISHLNASRTAVLIVRGLDPPGKTPIRWSSPSVVLGERALAGLFASHLYGADGELIIAAEQLIPGKDGALTSALVLREEAP